MADFADVAALEQWMATTGLGARGTTMLQAASALVRRETGQDIEATAGRQEEFAAMPYRRSFSVSQVPVTAVTSVTVDGASFTGFTWDRWTGQLRHDTGYWDEGPIIVTYDSGYDATSDEYLAVKFIVLEVASRALAPTGTTFETFATEVGEVRGAGVNVFLTDTERRELGGLRVMALA